MKEQYFADKRDFFKWDFIEDVVAGCLVFTTFTYIGMLTPPDDTKEGNLKKFDVGDRREPLFRFLQACVAEGCQRVSEMRGYFQGRRIAYRPYGDEPNAHYSFEAREKYFSNIPSADLQAALVFFDPDIGLKAGRESYMRRRGISKYLFDESLAAVADRASDDSVVIVYQHFQRDRSRFWDDVEERSERFRKAVGANGAAFLTDRDIAFLATSRDQKTRLQLSTAILTHSHKHRLDCGELAGQ